MSYDIYLKDERGETIMLPEKHGLAGGTYALGGTHEAWLNVTYNYSGHFYRVLGDKGIRTLYGMKAVQTVSLLERAITALDDDVSEDYWKPTEGNARRALENLLALARMAPDGIWDGD